MSKKNKGIFIGLIVLLIVIAGGTAYNRYETRKLEKQNTIVSSNKNNNNVNEQQSSVQKSEPIKDDKDNSLANKNTVPLIREFKEGNLIHNNKGIPVLYYHSIEYEKGNELRMPKEKFREQMKYLKDNNYTTITLGELYEFIQNNKPVPAKSIVITFDDGYEDNYTNAFPIMKEFGIKASVFMITDFADKVNGGYLNSNEMREMEANGIEIESHTVHHDKLSQLTYDQQLKTLKDSKQFLEKTLNKKIDYIVYPFGMYNKDTIKAAKEAGYAMGFTTVGGWADKQDGVYTLNRIYMNSFDSMDKFKYMLTNPNYDRK